VDKRESLNAFGGDTERYDEKVKAQEELEAIAIQKDAFIDQVVGTFYDKENRFAVNETARLYNAADVAAFNIAVAEPGPGSKTTPGFIPALSNNELRELLAANQNADIAIPVFADSDCLRDCIGFVICRGSGSNFEVLDANPFGANQYDKDELYELFSAVRAKCSWLNVAQKSKKLDVNNLQKVIQAVDGFFLEDDKYTEDAKRMKGRLLESES
jgi:hypothetical protein